MSGLVHVGERCGLSVRGVGWRACLERSGTLFGAAVRESGTKVPGGCRRGVAAAGSEGRCEDVAQRVGLPSGVVAVRLWLVVEASAPAHDGDGGVGEAGEVARQLAFSDAGAVLVEGEVADCRGGGSRSPSVRC